MVQILPNRTSMDNISAMKLGLVFDPDLLPHPRSIANQLTRKVIQARAYCQPKGIRLAFVIIQKEGVEFARYIDAMDGMVISSETDQFVTFVVPEKELHQVDAYIVFRAEGSEFSFERPLDSNVEVTELFVRIDPEPLMSKKTKPFSVANPKVTQLRDPYEHMRVPPEMFVNKIPNDFMDIMMQNKPEHPQDIRPGDVA